MSVLDVGPRCANCGHHEGQHIEQDRFRHNGTERLGCIKLVRTFDKWEVCWCNRFKEESGMSEETQRWICPNCDQALIGFEAIGQHVMDEAKQTYRYEGAGGRVTVRPSPAGVYLMVDNGRGSHCEVEIGPEVAMTLFHTGLMAASREL